MKTDHPRLPRPPISTLLAVMAVWAASGPAVAAATQATAARTYSAHQLACAPRAVRSMAPPGVHVIGSPMPGRRLFGTGDLVMIDRGSHEGLAVGQELAVRRLVPSTERAARRDPWLRVHTAGWIRLVDVGPATAIAQVVYACDALEIGDFLEPFSMPEVPAAAESAGEPDYQQAGRVLFADERRTMAGPPTFVVIDLGADQGLKPGQRITLFRRLGGSPGPTSALGVGVVMVVLPESATVRIEQATEPVLVGDLAAPHRQ